MIIILPKTIIFIHYTNQIKYCMINIRKGEKFYMMRGDKYNNIIEINDYKNIINPKRDYYNDYIYKKDDYYKATSFSDLFKVSRKDIENLVNYFEQIMSQYHIDIDTLKGIILNKAYVLKNPTDKALFSAAFFYLDKKQSIQSQTQSQTSQTQSTQSQTQSSTNQIQPQPTLPKGSSYNASAMWSPVSYAGTVYEWNRGVIGISYDGNVEKESLDGTYNHHADASVRVSSALGASIPMTTAPFEAGINASEKGVLILQAEGANCFVYFPESITTKQQQELIKAVTPRSGFEFSFVRGDEMFQFQTAKDVIEYTNALASLSNQTASTRVSR